jgi:hypothetical protein
MAVEERGSEVGQEKSTEAAKNVEARRRSARFPRNPSAERRKESESLTMKDKEQKSQGENNPSEPQIINYEMHGQVQTPAVKPLGMSNEDVQKGFRKISMPDDPRSGTNDGVTP